MTLYEGYVCHIFVIVRVGVIYPWQILPSQLRGDTNVKCVTGTLKAAFFFENFSIFDRQALRKQL